MGTTNAVRYPLATSAEAEIRVLKPLSHIKNNDVNSHIQQAVEYIGGGDTHFVNTRCSMKRSRVNDECILESNYNKCIKIDEDTSQCDQGNYVFNINLSHYLTVPEIRGE